MKTDNELKSQEFAQTMVAFEKRMNELLNFHEKDLADKNHL